MGFPKGSHQGTVYRGHSISRPQLSPSQSYDSGEIQRELGGCLSIPKPPPLPTATGSRSGSGSPAVVMPGLKSLATSAWRWLVAHQLTMRRISKWVWLVFLELLRACLWFARENKRKTTHCVVRFLKKRHPQAGPLVQFPGRRYPWPSLTKVNLVNRYDRVLLNVDQFYFCKGISSNVSSNTRIMQ